MFVCLGQWKHDVVFCKHSSAGFVCACIDMFVCVCVHVYVCVGFGHSGI